MISQFHDLAKIKFGDINIRKLVGSIFHDLVTTKFGKIY